MIDLAETIERRQVPVYLAALVVGVAIGAVAPSSSGAFESAVHPVLGALLLATFLQVPFDRLKDAVLTAGSCRACWF